MRETIYVLNGPNLNLLGQREPEIYGRDTLAQVEARCRELTDAQGVALDFRQTNAEHVMVDWEAEWRSKSIMTQVVTGTIAGLGVHGYALAIQHLLHRPGAARR